jgi:adenylate kinase
LGLIILVTGTPGVGKSRLASLLSKRRGFKLLELSLLVKREGLYTGFDKERKSYVVDERRLRKRLETISRSSENLVIASHMVGRFLPKGLVKMAIVLRLDPVVLYRRLRARGWTSRKAWENTEAEILDISLQESIKFLGRRRVFEIDTTRKSAAVICKEALRALSGKSSGRVGHVDWLSRYDPVLLERQL